MMKMSLRRLFFILLVAGVLLVAPAALSEAGLILPDATGAPGQAPDTGLLLSDQGDELTLELSAQLYVQAAATSAPYDPQANEAVRATRSINGWKGWGYVVYTYDELIYEIKNPKMGRNTWYDGTSNVMRLYLGYYPAAGYSGAGATRQSAFAGSGAVTVMPGLVTRDGSNGNYNSTYGLGFTKVEIVGTDPYEVTAANNRSMDKSYWQTVTWNSSSYMIQAGNSGGQYIAIQHGFYKTTGAGGIGTRSGSQQTTMELYNAEFEGGILFNNGSMTGTNHNTIIHNSNVYWTRASAFCIKTSNNLRINRWAGSARSYFESQVTGSLVVFDNTTTNLVEVNDILSGNTDNFLELNLCAGSSFISPTADYRGEFTFNRSTGFLMNGNGLLSSRAMKGITLGTYLAGSKPSFTINAPASGTHDTIASGFAFLHVNTTFSVGDGWNVDINYRAASDSNRSAFRLGTEGALTLGGGSTMRVSHVGGAPAAATNSGGALSVGGGVITVGRSASSPATLIVDFRPDGGSGHALFPSHATNGRLVIGAGSVVQVTQNGNGTGSAVNAPGTTAPGIDVSGTLKVSQESGTGSAVYTARLFRLNATGRAEIYRTPANATAPAADLYYCTAASGSRLIIEDGGSAHAALRVRYAGTSFASGSRVSLSNPNGPLIAGDSTTTRTVSLAGSAMTLYTGAQTYVWNQSSFASFTVSGTVTATATSITAPTSFTAVDPQSPWDRSLFTLTSAANRLELGLVSSFAVTAPYRGNGQSVVTGSFPSAPAVENFGRVMATEYEMVNMAVSTARQSSSMQPAAPAVFSIAMPSPLSDALSSVCAIVDIDNLRAAARINTVGQVWVQVPASVIFEDLDATLTDQVARRHQGDGASIPDYTDWPITVHDTRPYHAANGAWTASNVSLTAYMNNRFQTSDGIRTMPNSRIIWVETAGSNGTKLGVPPESFATIIASRRMDPDSYAYTVNKGPDEGLMFSYIGGEAESGEQYQATITWTLTY